MYTTEDTFEDIEMKNHKLITLSNYRFLLLKFPSYKSFTRAKFSNHCESLLQSKAFSQRQKRWNPTITNHDHVGGISSVMKK